MVMLKGTAVMGVRGSCAISVTVDPTDMRQSRILRSDFINYDFSRFYQNLAELAIGFASCRQLDGLNLPLRKSIADDNRPVASDEMKELTVKSDQPSAKATAWQASDENAGETPAATEQKNYSGSVSPEPPIS